MRFTSVRRKLAHEVLHTFICIDIGQRRIPAGRIGEAPSVGLSASLRKAGFQLGRLQTGTPARLDGKTINFQRLQRVDGDDRPHPFSFVNDSVTNAVIMNS